MSEYFPPFFKKFGKGLDDLFSKKFGSKKETRVKTKTSDGTTFDSAIAYKDKDGTYAGSLKLTRDFPEFGKTEFEFDTSGATKGTVELDKLFSVKGLMVKASGSEKPDGTFEFEYKRPFFSLTSAFNVSQKAYTVEEGAAVGFDGLSIGGLAKYDLTNQSLEDYNAGVEYSGKDFTTTLKTEEQADVVVGSFQHKATDNLEVGGRLRYNISSPARLFTFGGALKVDADTNVKVKASSDGILEAAYEQRLANPKLKYAFSSKFEAKTVAPQEFGVSFQFGDE